MYAVIVALVLAAWAVSCAGAVVAGGTVRVECLAAPGVTPMTVPR